MAVPDVTPDQNNNITKVTLPVAIVIGILGIIIATSLIYCVLVGCNKIGEQIQSSNFQKESLAAQTRPLQYLQNVSLPRPQQTSTLIKPPPQKAEVLKALDIYPQVLISKQAQAGLPPMNNRFPQLLGAARNLGNAVENMVGNVKVIQKGGKGKINGLVALFLVWIYSKLL